MNEIIQQSASRMAELIRAREVSSEELVRAHLERIQTVNGRINAVCHMRSDEALKEAKQKDAALARGEIAGPLHGVPMTVKDSLETAGVLSTSGTLGRAKFVPDRDASTVGLMRSAGAVVIGKTNVPELCLSFESDNLVYGRTNNPYDVTKTSGGSSGGEAAIIAAAGSPIGLGSDAGGSVRLPAHFCGIAGIKPTSGRLPKTGHFLPPGGAVDRLWQVGPMARFVDDLILLMPILAQADGIDSSVVPMPLLDPRGVHLKNLRVAFYTSNGAAPATDETAAVVSRAARSFADAGAVVEEACPDRTGASAALWFDLICPDGAAGLRRLLSAIGTVEFHPFLKRFLEIAETRQVSISAYLELMAGWDELRTRMLAFLNRYDAIVCPVAAGPAIPHGTSFDRIDMFTYTMDYNFAGWPGAVVRCGTSPEGLPIGVQVVAHPWREDVALAMARHLETEFGGWSAPPDPRDDK